jgi:hypothetical protein
MLARPECPSCDPVTSLCPRKKAKYRVCGSVSECSFDAYRHIDTILIDDFAGASYSCLIAPTSWLDLESNYYGSSTIVHCNFHVSYFTPVVDTGASIGYWYLPQPACIPGCGAPVPGQPGATVVGQLFITDVTGDGIVTDKQYVPGTIPPNTVLLECLTDNDNIEIHFMSEGGINYSPIVTLDGVTQCTNLQQYANDQRLFYGSIPAIIESTKVFTISSTAGGISTVKINRAAAGPEILTCVIGDYPGSQTAAKQGDKIHVTGTVESSATEVRLLPYGAFSGTGWISCSGGVFDILGTVSSAIGLQKARVEARNAIGTVGRTADSSNEIELDQTYPSFTDHGCTYPAGQAAFKGTETGTQSTVVSGADNFTYSSPNFDFSITSPNVYEENKSIVCNNPGSYNDSVSNFRIVAIRSRNDAQSIFNKIIEVADIAPVVTASQPYSRLRSSPAGADYTISANSNQNLATAPSVSIPVSGTWRGTGFVGGPKNWSRTIRISDADAKGTGPWAWDGTAPKNRAGLSASIQGSETVGGFYSRHLILAPFSTRTELDVAVVDTNKLSFNWSFKSPMIFNPVGTQPPVAGAWTLEALNTNPTDVIILDTAAANSSSQESVITIEEVV